MAVLLLAAALVLLAIAPAVQTWIARLALSHRPGIQGSLGSLSAGFGEVDIEDLHLVANGAILSIPSLQAKLPLTGMLLERRIRVGGLVAKGWTLDLSHVVKTAGEPSRTVSGNEVALAFLGVLSRSKLPIDATLDGVDLEGDVIVAGAPPASALIHAHWVLSGGGIAPGREGTLTFDTDINSEDLGANLNGVSAHGRFSVAMDAVRKVTRLGINADVSARSGLQDLALSAEVVAGPGADDETYTLALQRARRQPLTLRAHFSGATRRFDGTWKLDLEEPDLEAFAADGTLPVSSAEGEGQFDADASFNQVHAVGGLRAALGALGAVGALERVGKIALDTRFDVVRNGDSIEVNHLRVAAEGAKPIAVADSLQPFEFNARTRDLKLSEPGGDWLDVSIRAFPLAWLAGPTSRFTLSDGAAAGELVVRAEKGGLTLRAKTPLTAVGVSLQKDGATLCRGLDLEVSPIANFGPGGWQVQWAPLTVDRAGRRLAAIEGSASRPPGPDQPVKVTGSWKADVEALLSGQADQGPGGTTVRSASGDFSANLGESTQMDAKMVLLGDSPDPLVSANVHAEVDPDGDVEFFAPIKVAFGTSRSDVSAEGTWTGRNADARIDVKLSSEDVALEHLRWLAAPWAAFSGGGLAPASSAPGGARDPIPFWGNWVGRVAFALVRLRTDDGVFRHVDGLFDIGHGYLRLVGGQCSLAHDNFAKFEGSLSFDDSAELPYHLNGTVAFHEFDVANFYPATPKQEEPQLEGRFNLAGTVAGVGMNLDDLLGRTQEKFQLSSTSGIIRFLKTSVAESIPEVSSPVSDTLGTVGSLAGAVFGIKGDSDKAANNPVSANAQAVIDLTNQVSEIGCDQIAVTAVRGSDGSLQLSGIELTAADEHLTGSGQIRSMKGVPVFEQPLAMDLQLGARGPIAELLAKAGLLSSQKDSLGYPLATPSIHFGGTLEQIDESQWHDLLVKAATRKPEPVKKGS